MNTKDNPLKALVVDNAKEINMEKLAIFLEPFFGIDSKTKEIVQKELFSEINGNTNKIEVILVASKARALLFDLLDGMSPKELISMGIMAEGSVKSSLRMLLKDHKIKKDENGKYFIPSYRIPSIIKEYESK